MKILSILLLFILPVSGCALSHRYEVQNQALLEFINKQPDQFIGNVFAFEGQVLKSAKSADGTYLQVLVGDAGGSGASLLGVYFPKRGFDAERGNKVRVLGSVTGGMQSKNIFGGPIRSLTVRGIGLSNRSRHEVRSTGESPEVFKKWQAGTLFRNIPGP